MARKLKQFTPPERTGGREPRYPWKQWLDGNTWELVQGKDFQSTVKTMQKFIRQVASNRGILISVYQTAPNTLVITPRQRAAG